MRVRAALSAILVPAALWAAAQPPPAAAASLRTVAVAHGAIDEDDYGYDEYPAPCLAVAASGWVHVLVGGRALERVPGGAFATSRFAAGKTAPCGFGYTTDGDLITSYSRYLYTDYRDGDIYDVGYELRRPGSDGGPHVSTSGNAQEDERPDAPLLADAGGAVLVFRDLYDAVDVVVERAHGTQRSGLRLRWSRPKPWEVSAIAAAGSPRGGAATIVTLEREPRKGPTLYRHVVATRGRSGAFTGATTLRLGELSAAKVAVTEGGAVLAALQRPDERVELAAGTVTRRVRRRGRALDGSRTVLAADGERGLLAYEVCPKKRGRCAVRTRPVSAAGVPGTPSPVLGHLPRPDAVHVRTGSGGRALVWWTAGRHLRIAVRGKDGRYGRPQTVTSAARSGTKVLWGQGDEVLATWTAKDQQVAVVLRAR